ncbi:MAG: hypothetical protein AMJ54_15445, partial [Deltaproteobacteria bacterium SG8_13]
MQQTSIQNHFNWKKAMTSILKPSSVWRSSVHSFGFFPYRAFLFAVIIMLVSPAPTPAAQWTLQPRASVQGEYTDNLFLTPDNEKDDYLITTSVGLTAGVAGQTAEASFSYDPSYAWYDEYAENNGWRHNASLLAGWDISKNTRLDFSDYFVHTEDPLSEQEIDVLRGLVPPPQADTTVRIDRRPYSR